MTLEEYLKEYKALTLDIMDQVSFDGNIKHLVEERENIIETVKELNFNKNDIKKIAQELKLLELDKEMNRLVKVEMKNIKTKLNNLKKNQAGNQHYLNSFKSEYNGYAQFDRLF